MEIKRIDLDVLEYRDLDSLFLSGQLDLILTARQPSKQKFKHSIEIGYQQHEIVSTDKKCLVLSPFEWAQTGSQRVSDYKHFLVSNSLQIRDRWLKDFGGTGTLPVDARRGKGKGHYSVILLGHDLISPRLWDKIGEIVSDF